MIYRGETKIILAHDIHLAEHGDKEALERIKDFNKTVQNQQPLDTDDV